MPGITEEGQGCTTFRIEGRLTGQMVTELERRWRGAEHSGARPLRLDLCHVAEIDDAGKELLREMFARGVEFVVAAHSTTHWTV